VREENWGYVQYLDRLMSMRCFQDLVALKVFSTAKDMSESMGVLQAAGFHARMTVEVRTRE
jgi:hypothetical protein